jgi:NADPH-dependent glutamate synthase beta subunit-like oxidoreductase
MVRIAIVGSGPAGVNCARKLKEEKKDEISITVFDERKEFGGMLAYGIPEYRVSLEQARINIVKLEEMGIKFERKKIFSIKSLLKDFGGEFDFVVLALGAGEGLKLGMKGEESKRVIESLEFLEKLKLEKKSMIEEGEKIAIVGGGNAAVDTAIQTAMITEDVTLIYRRTEKEMPAFGNEIENAKKKGVKFEFLKAPFAYEEKEKGIEVELAIMKLGKEDESGRARPEDTGERVKEEFDKVLLSIGQKQEFEWLKKEGILAEKGIKVDEKNETSLKNVYACGDCVYGAKNIGAATIDGLKTAESILSRI